MLKSLIWLSPNRSPFSLIKDASYTLCSEYTILFHHLNCFWVQKSIRNITFVKWIPKTIIKIFFNNTVNCNVAYYIYKSIAANQKIILCSCHFNRWCVLIL
ncbi:hypothetical protein BI065_gp22 [Weissella phage WCP30]|uniref:hypothetical protein n=1 Tax=Weissella phage WCP30 TaxID=1837862 RepID=UPI0008111B33|nr:hypothetical protein BI065_gp22 [Weissella phage WCP30]ANU78897.1 hypothetical protein [Weissella phage WCP30]